MTIAPQWFALAGAVTLINGATLGFIAWREGDRPLRAWAWAWLAWAAAIVPLALGQNRPSALTGLTCGLLWVVSSLCFLSGSYALLEQRLPRAWYGVAALCVAVALVLGVGPVGATGMIPLVLFQSVGQLVTGFLIIRRARGLVGAWLAGAALVVLALHLLDAPLLARSPQLIAWGFVVATGLEVLTALGMVTMHYEQARLRLLEAQRVLAEARQMEALGRVAGGVAHDFNNLLTIMQGNLELLSLERPGANGPPESLLAIERAIGQATRLTAQLLSFGRRAVVQPRAIDLREVVNDSIELLKSAMPQGVQLSFRAGEGHYTATFDRALLEQIVLNLVSNARDAIVGAGEIKVELEHHTFPEPHARLRVSDDGRGMDEVVLKQIFEPFFTTKGAGRGTGLGLASVQGAVSQLGGQIQVESRVSEGTSFVVSLPLVRSEGPAESIISSTQVERLRILVVDDEDDVRAVTIRMLQSGGHEVDGASDGVDALEKLAVGHYDLVLTDVVMPHLDGPTLLREVAKLSVAPLVVLASGYPMGAQLDISGMHFITKPFKRTALLSALALLVSEQRAPARRSSGLVWPGDSCSGAAEPIAPGARRSAE
jgi:signal transduction histidine kinase/ActR/RegA family two-component response regulator